MPWLIALNVAMYIGALYLFISVGIVQAVICFILAALLSLILSGGKFNPFEFLD